MNRIPCKSMTLIGHQYRFTAPVNTTDRVETGEVNGIKVGVFWWPAFQSVEVSVAGESTVHHHSVCRVVLSDSVTNLIEPNRLPPNVQQAASQQSAGARSTKR
jgi:hypothetical protein